ncbi:c-type cytochrome biogenesis protein CcsB [Nocardioides donggukensis]|uniref:C-type cytochrome biogenesis protein CcsB n=1 Tax=Nocardioides donggukensis TaxID=2774019 RepID=A0A927K5C2_9ACTN|nr:c-type cytochrome biogenesis protein CcsB [Nocardioides donggukensis]MBD8870819.1 c-type cytochrome biogenesis protein CcsB [Nocardioides donggukensis]
MTNASWESLSNQAVTVAGIVYFLALLAHSAQWAMLRRLPADQTPEGDQTEVFGRFGLLLTAIAAVVHAVGLVGRGLAADPNRVPWGNMYEFTLSGTFVVTLGYLALHRRYRLAWMAPWVVGFVFVILMAAVIWLYEPVAPLTEALSSPWLVIHVVAAVIATGIFSLAGLVSAVYLLKSRVLERQRRSTAVPVGAAAGGGSAVGASTAGGSGTRADAPATGMMARIPDLPALDRLSYRLHAFAFPIWTFAVLISGPIWAHYAWSRYWGWDPKEVWAFITWVVYAAYLHARATAGWKGRNAAIVALVGVATLWFNFIGINYFFGGSSQHSYAAPAAVVERQEPPGPGGASGPVVTRGDLSVDLPEALSTG